MASKVDLFFVLVEGGEGLSKIPLWGGEPCFLANLPNLGPYGGGFYCNRFEIIHPLPLGEDRLPDFPERQPQGLPTQPTQRRSPSPGPSLQLGPRKHGYGYLHWS